MYTPSPTPPAKSMNTERPLVFVVDDDVSTREALEALLEHAGFKPILFETARAFLSFVRPRVPSCLVLDLNLPDLNGLDLQSMIAVETDRIPIIFITGYGDAPSIVRAMKAGAIEFLTKPLDAEALLSAVRDAIERSRATLRVDTASQVVRDRYATLSRREREVMTLVIAGSMNKQIAAELGISEVTVKAHRGKVMQKMKAASLADLINMQAQVGRPAPPVKRG
ncbi:DNA-binding response regulator [Azorhizobium oxalatiphilum]|uniref:DNA-binding response regulator n=1 Tax=Azorhizobium oxalatiphilum TaxID=980631 RepID=A0A917CKR0_9HYPH|nr:response regulator [Azorhizobium oxalatiphilum]GGF89470.1 DNA-binding response regulator [Azorhizobium oxalatiphilum]